MVIVQKSTGEKENFNEEKLKSSIKRAGIPDELQKLVLEDIKSKLYDGIKTSEIYDHALEFLGKSTHPYSRAKYGLKKAISDLGPTGYPFEDFVAAIFRHQGYITQTRSILQGNCISHEIDIVAEKENKKFMVECKFHNDNGIKSDVHVSLYTKARFEDLKNQSFNQAWLVTNTKVTTDALNYTKCSNMKVISWDYPANEGLRDLIEKLNLHPITTLTTLSQSQKQILLDNHTVHCMKLCQEPQRLAVLNLPKEKIEEILAEAKFVCS